MNWGLSAYSKNNSRPLGGTRRTSSIGLLYEIGELMLRAEIDDHLEAIEIMLEDGSTGPPGD